MDMGTRWLATDPQVFVTQLQMWRRDHEEQARQEQTIASCLRIVSTFPLITARP